ncbi:hypothetical protein A8C56_01180 [Niabella ginsenosidivorans]|uniref:Uncharacterized protein n=1 Tax=Niabella ginsenosidivorans TaxID=1176587 RepID=A0A1A9HWJ9_9BACT|nr:hypothetical protein A8C56_01180 [Niabella ginsenosidivorans]
MGLLFDWNLHVRGRPKGGAFFWLSLLCASFIIVFGAYELPLVGWRGDQKVPFVMLNLFQHLKWRLIVNRF